MRFTLFGKTFRIRLPWEKEACTYSNNTEHPIITAESVRQAVKNIREHKVTTEMWVTQTDKEWIKELCVSVPGEPCYVSTFWGIKLYTSEFIPNNYAKVVSSDGTVGWIKLREDSNEKESRKV